MLGSQSELPKDKAFLLMHSRHATNLYDPKIERIFKIPGTLFEIILSNHFNPQINAWPEPKALYENFL